MAYSSWKRKKKNWGRRIFYTLNSKSNWLCIFFSLDKYNPRIHQPKILKCYVESLLISEASHKQPSSICYPKVQFFTRIRRRVKSTFLYFFVGFHPHQVHILMGIWNYLKTSIQVLTSYMCLETLDKHWLMVILLTLWIYKAYI